MRRSRTGLKIRWLASAGEEAEGNGPDQAQYEAQYRLDHEESRHKPRIALAGVSKGK